MFKLDPEFRQLIPPLASEERSQLEANIVADGCRDPLTVWQEQGLLLDGHNRFEICAKHGTEYELHYVSLPSRQAAINWIINNQLGRRNVTTEQASYLRGKRYNSEKSQGQRTDLTLDQNDPKSHTAQRLADEFKVSEPTIKRDGKFAASVDLIADVAGETARAAILSGDSKLTKQDVVDAAEYFKSKPTIEQRAEDLAGDEDAYDWVDERSCTDCKFFQSNYPDNWCTALERKLGTEDVIMLCNGDKWVDQYAPVEPTPEVFVARTEKEILEAAKRIRDAKQAGKKELIEQKKQEAMAVEAATIEDAPDVYLADAIEFLSGYEDNHFDLLFTDPPYATDVDDIAAFAAEWVPLALSFLINVWPQFTSYDFADQDIRYIKLSAQFTLAISTA